MKVELHTPGGVVSHSPVVLLQTLPAGHGFTYGALGQIGAQPHVPAEVQTFVGGQMLQSAPDCVSLQTCKAAG